MEIAGSGLRHGLGDVGKVGETDGAGQAAVLGEVQELADERRYDDPEGLRERYLTQSSHGRETQGAGRLNLSPSHGLDAGADDFGDEGRGVHHQANQEGQQSAGNGEATGDTPEGALGLRLGHHQGGAGGKTDDHPGHRSNDHRGP